MSKSIFSLSLLALYVLAAASLSLEVRKRNSGKQDGTSLKHKQFVLQQQDVTKTGDYGQRGSKLCQPSKKVAKPKEIEYDDYEGDDEKKQFVLQEDVIKNGAYKERSPGLNNDNCTEVEDSEQEEDNYVSLDNEGEEEKGSEYEDSASEEGSEDEDSASEESTYEYEVYDYDQDYYDDYTGTEAYYDDDKTSK